MTFWFFCSFQRLKIETEKSFITKKSMYPFANKITDRHVTFLESL